MKKALIIISTSLIILFYGCGIYQQSVGLVLKSPLTNSEKPIVYEEIVEHSKPIEKVYTSMKLWFTENFKNANYVVQFDDKELGKLTGKGTFQHEPPVHFGSGPIRGNVSFVIDLSLKENKYRIKVYNFTHSGQDYYSPQLKSNISANNMGLLMDCEYPECKPSGDKFLKENWIQFHNDSYEFGNGIIESIKSKVEKDGSDNW